MTRDPQPLDVSSVPPRAVPHLTVDMFTALYPWAHIHRVQTCEAIDRELGILAARAAPCAPNRALEDRQWTAGPIAAVDHVNLLNPTPLGTTDHIAAHCRDTSETGRRRLVLSLRRDTDLFIVRCGLEPVDEEEVDRPVASPASLSGRIDAARLSSLYPGLKPSQIATAVAVDDGLADVPRRWAPVMEVVRSGGLYVRVDPATLGTQMRRIVAKAHQRGERYSARPGRLVLGVDGLGEDSLFVHYGVDHGTGGDKVPPACSAKSSAKATQSGAAAVDIVPDPARSSSKGTQTAADIVALYPGLTVDQAARLFVAAVQLAEVPHRWISAEAFGNERHIAVTLHASAPSMVLLRETTKSWDGSSSVVLTLRDAHDAICYRIVDGAPEAKVQSDADLVALYPSLSPIEAMGVGAINRVLDAMPHVWVATKTGSRYPHSVSLGLGGPPVPDTIDAIHRLCADSRISRIILSLGRTDAGALTLDYGAVVRH